MLYDSGQHTEEALRLGGKTARGVVYDDGEGPEEVLLASAHDS